MDLNEYIRDIPDFPKKGIVFKDITNLLKNESSFLHTVKAFKNRLNNINVNQIIGIESRGFILAAALATSIGCGFIPIRKKGKLPHKTFTQNYNLEYGEDTLEIHTDALRPNENVILIDDVLATGGTVEASIKLLKNFNVNIIECQFLIEISSLKGKNKIIQNSIDYFSLLKYK